LRAYLPTGKIKTKHGKYEETHQYKKKKNNIEMYRITKKGRKESSRKPKSKKNGKEIVSESSFRRPSPLYFSPGVRLSRHLATQSQTKTTE